MKNKLRYNAAIIIACLVLLLASLSGRQQPQGQGFTAHRMVAHALGGINGMTYTNTYEAFIANYEKGFRIFEADLLLSSDDQLIARHEWGESFTKMMGQQDELEPDRHSAIFSHEEFKAAKIMGQYEPLDWDDILGLMELYPDVYFVTDTKQSKPEEIQRIFTQIVAKAKAKDPALLDRIVPQIYNRPMLEPLKEIYPFPSVIFTLYQTNDTDEEVVQFAKEAGITAITMSEQRANSRLISALNRIGVVSYVHTINDPKKMTAFKMMGAYGFYTDFLTEDDVAKPGWILALGR